MNHEIALVDDDRNILTSVSIALQAEGFVTRVYTDPTAALKAFAEKEPDLGVFDIKMPHMDGMELLRRVREFSAMPVIFLTSKDDELDEALGLAIITLLEDRALAAKLGANARATVLANFDWRQICVRIECIYDKLLAALTEAASRAENQPASFATRVR